MNAVWRASSGLLACLAWAGWCAAAPFEPDDPYYPTWYSAKLGLAEAWGYSLGTDRVTIAVLDTGVINDAPDLAGRVMGPLSATGSAPLSGYEHHHGTWVASVAAMQIDNGIGGFGVGNFSILPITTTNAQGNALSDWHAEGIRMAADAGARVINISSSSLSYWLLDEAAEYARSKGALTFVAAGNDNSRRTNIEDYPNLIFVSGTDRFDQRWSSGTSGSTWGPFVDLAAPSEGIVVAEPDNPSFPGGYAYGSGTSFAAPLAAGAAALAWSINPQLTPDEVQAMLFETAVDLGPIGRDEYFGWGRIDIGAVARAAAVTVPEPGGVWAWCVAGVLVGRRRRK